ncbi:MAG: hypothetical protein MJ103_05315, partial [Saccharofermentans sp.]|nr:hypothetical protein [Saccharofermentans sp.]
KKEATMSSSTAASLVQTQYLFNLPCGGMPTIGRLFFMSHWNHPLTFYVAYGYIIVEPKMNCVIVK